MKIERELIIYCLESVLSPFIIFKFMNIFFDRTTADKRKEIILYLTYYLISTAVYLFINIPIVTMMTNLVLYYLIALNYDGSIRKRFLAVILTYLIFICVETVLVIALFGMNVGIFSKNKYGISSGYIMVEIIILFIAEMLSRRKNIKRGKIVPGSYWVCIVIVPITTIYIIFLLFTTDQVAEVRIVISLVLLFAVNLAIFYLYDAISKVLTDEMEQKMLYQQKEAYEKQLNIMRCSMKNAHSFQHDFRNHLITLNSMVIGGKNQAAEKYVKELLEDCSCYKKYVYTGNTAIDSILNFKMQEATQAGIRFRHDIYVPKDLQISDFDMSIILGNLLDNAISAAKEVMDNPYIELQVKYDRGRIIIRMENPYIGDVKKMKEKRDIFAKGETNHGIGLQNIRNVLEKYEGSMEIEDKEQKYIALLLMFLKEK